MLEAAGGQVVQAIVYVSRDVTDPHPEIVDALTTSRIDWTTVTSSAIARSLVHMFGDKLRKTKLAAISPLTAEVLTEQGYAPAVVAGAYTMDGIIEAILASRQVKA